MNWLRRPGRRKPRPPARCNSPGRSSDTFTSYGPARATSGPFRNPFARGSRCSLRSFGHHTAVPGRTGRPAVFFARPGPRLALTYYDMKHFRILVLEDVFVTSLAIGRALEFELPDCVVMRAQSLYEARVFLKTYDFDFFILDIQLPDGCGIDFLSDIAQRAPGGPVIILTATRLPKYRERAAAFGVLDFMEKPVDMASLARRIAGHLRGLEAP